MSNIRTKQNTTKKNKKIIFVRSEYARLCAGSTGGGALSQCHAPKKSRIILIIRQLRIFR